MQNMQIHQSETDADSGVDESTQNATSPNKAHNGSSGNTSNSRIPKKTPPATPHHKSRGRSTDDKSFVPRRPVRSKSVPKPFTSFALTAPIMDDTTSPVKKLPMNKIKVGMTSSPNLKKIQSKVGSLSNASYKPGGGDFKIKSQKLEWKAQPKTAAFNDGYTPKGGDKKIENKKLEWNITSKVGSLDNASHRPGGGEKRIASQKLEWKGKSKVGSIDNIKHKPGGGNIKIENRKIDLKVESKVGSLDNVKHRPGGGDKKVFNDIEYLKQMTDTTGAQLMAKSSGQNSECSSRRESAVQSPQPQSLGGGN